MILVIYLTSKDLKHSCINNVLGIIESECSNDKEKIYFFPFKWMMFQWYNTMKNDWNFNVFKNNDKTKFFPFLTDCLNLIDIPIDSNIGKTNSTFIIVQEKYSIKIFPISYTEAKQRISSRTFYLWNRLTFCSFI